MEDPHAYRRAIFELLDRPGAVEILFALRGGDGTATLAQLDAAGQGLPLVRRLAASGLICTHGSLDDDTNDAMPVSLTGSGYDVIDTLVRLEQRGLTHSPHLPEWVYRLRARLARFGRQ